MTRPDAKNRLLVALRGYRQQFQNIRCAQDIEAVACLDRAIKDIDWDAVEFAHQALASGAHLYSGWSTNDVLVKFHTDDDPDAASPDTDQLELPF